MPNRDLVRLQHVIQAGQKALELSAGKSRTEADADEALRLALIHLLEIMGEAATGLSSEFRQQNAEVPWTKIIALRNRLIHGYFDVDFDIVWDTIQERLHPLIPELEAIVSRMQ